MKKYIKLFLIVVVFSFVINGFSQQIVLGDCHIIHKKGNKKCEDNNKWKKETKKKGTFYRNLSFDIKFDENCKYVLENPCDNIQQRRKQKLMKLTTTQNFESKNSLRLGWYYDNNIGKIKLAFYSHINHLESIYGSSVGREYQTFEKEVDANEWIHVDMAISKKGMYMSVDGECIIISRDIFSWSEDGETTYLRANSYFEYEKKKDKDNCDSIGAPQDMDFYIKNAVMDSYDFPWKENEASCYTADNLKLMNTNFKFTDQGPYVFQAANTIEAPIVPSSKGSITTSLPYKIPFTVVEPNIDATFIASNSIRLKPGIVNDNWNVPTGFHAKSGSHFVAKIQPVESPIKILTEPWYEYAEPYYFTVENATSASINVDFSPDGSNKIISYGPISGEFYGNKIYFDLPFYNNGNTSGVYSVLASFANDCFMLKRDIQYYYSASGKTESENNSGVRILKYSNDTLRTPQVGFEQFETDDVDFKIFPNPSKGTIYIAFSGANINDYNVEVLNILGFKIYEQTGISSKQHFIDLSNQSGGIYIVKIMAGNKPLFQKVIID